MIKIISPIADAKTQMQRLDTCKLCPMSLNNNTKCKECGCYLAYKVMLTSSKCPLNKW